MFLSKSQYIRGLQCHKSLWLYKHKPELRTVPDDQQTSLFGEGIQVGDLAKQLFPGGVEIAYDGDDFQGMIDKTETLIRDGSEVLYEAAFSEQGIFVMVDIMVRNGSAWDVYEVKGSTSVKDVHINDAAIQWHALSHRLDLNRASIVHIDNSYVREKDLDVAKLFKIEDITESIKEQQSQVMKSLEVMETMLDGPIPEIDIGAQCSDPYECDFHAHCWQHIPYPSVFNLYWMNGGKKFTLYRDGILTYDDLPSDYRLNATQELQVTTAKTATPYINRNIIEDFLATVEYPINFFDFETFQNAIPRFEGQRPYMQIPFQYSLHILHKDGTLEHKEFLGDEFSDPRRALIEQMLNDMTSTGSIVAYNQAFEKSRINELALFDTQYRDQLLELNQRFVDLIVPFRKRGYYHPDFNGSFSIKSVLPAMFPNDDELDYKKLEIQNGGMAMDTFARLYLLNQAEQREKIRNDLLAYCRLDTLAMVRIWQRLQEIVKEKDL